MGLKTLTKSDPGFSNVPNLQLLMKQVKPCSVMVQKLPLDLEAIQDLRRQSSLGDPSVGSSREHREESSSEFITTVFDDLAMKHEDFSEDPLHIPAQLLLTSTAAKSDSSRSKRGPKSRTSRSGDQGDVIAGCELKKTTVQLPSLADLLDVDGSIKDEPDVIVSESDLSVISPIKIGSDPVETSSPCKRIRLDSRENRN